MEPNDSCIEVQVYDITLKTFQLDTTTFNYKHVCAIISSLRKCIQMEPNIYKEISLKWFYYAMDYFEAQIHNKVKKKFANELMNLIKDFVFIDNLKPQFLFQLLNIWYLMLLPIEKHRKNSYYLENKHVFKNLIKLIFSIGHHPCQYKLFVILINYIVCTKNRIDNLMELFPSDDMNWIRCALEKINVHDGEHEIRQILNKLNKEFTRNIFSLSFEKGVWLNIAKEFIAPNVLTNANTLLNVCRPLKFWLDFNVKHRSISFVVDVKTFDETLSNEWIQCEITEENLLNMSVENYAINSFVIKLTLKSSLLVYDAKFNGLIKDKELIFLISKKNADLKLEECVKLLEIIKKKQNIKSSFLKVLMKALDTSNEVHIKQEQETQLEKPDQDQNEKEESGTGTKLEEQKVKEERQNQEQQQKKEPSQKRKQKQEKRNELEQKKEQSQNHKQEQKNHHEQERKQEKEQVEKPQHQEPIQNERQIQQPIHEQNQSEEQIQQPKQEQKQPKDQVQQEQPPPVPLPVRNKKRSLFSHGQNNTVVNVSQNTLTHSYNLRSKEISQTAISNTVTINENMAIEVPLFDVLKQNIEGINKKLAKRRKRTYKEIKNKNVEAPRKPSVNRTRKQRKARINPTLSPPPTPLTSVPPVQKRPCELSATIRYSYKQFLPNNYELLGSEIIQKLYDNQSTPLMQQEQQQHQQPQLPATNKTITLQNSGNTYDINQSEASIVHVLDNGLQKEQQTMLNVNNTIDTSVINTTERSWLLNSFFESIENHNTRNGNNQNHQDQEEDDHSNNECPLVNTNFLEQSKYEYLQPIGYDYHSKANQLIETFKHELLLACKPKCIPTLKSIELTKIHCKLTINELCNDYRNDIQAFHSNIHDKLFVLKYLQKHNLTAEQRTMQVLHYTEKCLNDLKKNIGIVSNYWITAMNKLKLNGDDINNDILKMIDEMKESTWSDNIGNICPNI